MTFESKQERSDILFDVVWRWYLFETILATYSHVEFDVEDRQPQREQKSKDPESKTNEQRSRRKTASRGNSFIDIVQYLILYEEDTKKKTIATIIARASLNNIISGFMHRPSVLIEYKYNTSATISIVTGRGAFLLGPQEAGRSGLQHSTAQTKI